ncbi:hypothetical protein [Pseudomonas sp. PDM29]|jgi:hypothetical protein|uniref:hypothetical protein n=1 Tax=Pseudomonas sp. PDM29 TaxID=2854771 RepID=UPI003529AE65
MANIEPETLPHPEVDKVSEEAMARILGISFRALATRRARKQIPEGVWNKLGNRIMYSRKRYYEWEEAQWICPMELSSSANPSGFVLLGTVPAEAKPSPIPRRRKALKLHPNYAIK